MANQQLRRIIASTFMHPENKTLLDTPYPIVLLCAMPQKVSEEPDAGSSVRAALSDLNF